MRGDVCCKSVGVGRCVVVCCCRGCGRQCAKEISRNFCYRCDGGGVFFFLWIEVGDECDGDGALIGQNGLHILNEVFLSHAHGVFLQFIKCHQVQQFRRCDDEFVIGE